MSALSAELLDLLIVAYMVFGLVALLKIITQNLETGLPRVIGRTISKLLSDECSNCIGEREQAYQLDSCAATRTTVIM